MATVRLAEEAAAWLHDRTVRRHKPSKLCLSTAGRLVADVEELLHVDSQTDSNSSHRTRIRMATTACVAVEVPKTSFPEAAEASKPTVVALPLPT
jgi:hypothetical protein